MMDDDEIQADDPKVADAKPLDWVLAVLFIAIGALIASVALRWIP